MVQLSEVLFNITLKMTMNKTRAAEVIHENLISLVACFIVDKVS